MAAARVPAAGRLAHLVPAIRLGDVGPHDCTFRALIFWCATRRATRTPASGGDEPQEAEEGVGDGRSGEGGEADVGGDEAHAEEREPAGPEREDREARPHDQQAELERRALGPAFTDAGEDRGQDEQPAEVRGQGLEVRLAVGAHAARSRGPRTGAR